MSQVESVARMFCGCSNLSAIPDINRWNIDHVKEKFDIFKGCSNKLIIPPKFMKVS